MKEEALIFTDTKTSQRHTHSEEQMHYSLALWI